MIKLKDILTPLEEAELKKLIDNQIAKEALKKVFLKCLYYDGVLDAREAEPRRNFICQLLYNDDMSMDYNISNERLGEKTRAVVEGIRLVEQSFREMELLRDKQEIEEKEINEAR